MTQEESKRLEEFKLKGTLSQDQAREYHDLLVKELIGEPEPVKADEVVEVKRGRPAKK